MANGYWFDNPEYSTQLTPEEQELLKDEKPFVVRSFGNLDQPTLEAMIIGHMIVDSKVDDESSRKAKMDKIVSSGITDAWFERQDLGRLFNDLKNRYKEAKKNGKHEIASIDEMGAACLSNGGTQSQASAYKHKLRICRGTLHAWRIGLDILIERFWSHYSQKSTERFYRRYREECANPVLGPLKAAASLADGLKKVVREPAAAEIKMFDLVDDFPSTMGWLTDMKDNPEKHRGFMCGLKAIDKKTHGFRKGHLSVVVGSHGGFKTTLMMNMAYGLYLNGHNVLYVSLEMEKDIIQTKLWCRATGMVPYSRLYQGHITQDKDWDKVKELEEALFDPTLTEKDKAEKSIQLESLRSLLRGGIRGKDDYSLIEKAKKDFESGRKNKFRTLVAGQSKKIKASQIESFLLENMADFKPDVVFLDYLALMDSETPYPDRPDLGFGEICQYAREMGKNLGFSVVTAAQIKRAAIERIRKSGNDTPEKASVGTDDIEDSNKIGANADNVFILWKEPGGNSVRVFTAKSRYGEKDVEKGDSIQIDHETCTMSDNVMDTSSVAAGMTMGDTARVKSGMKKERDGGMPAYVKTDLSDGGEDYFANPAVDRPLDGDGSIAGYMEPPKDGLDI